MSETRAERARDTSHECPAPRCEARVPFAMLACPRHWRVLPNTLKGPVLAAWRRGAWEEHAAARQAAVEWWERNP